MKRMLLAVSLVANVVLVVVVAWLASRRPSDTQTTTSDMSQGGAASKTSLNSRTNVIEKVTTDVVKVDWRMVESEDYRQYIANLRAIGCPEETIRDIIIADVNKLFASRVAALYPTPSDYKFWRVEDLEARKEQRDREQKRRALEREKQDLIKELLGVDYETAIARWSGRPDDEAYRYGFLSAEKQQA